jgi:type II secretory ATPase GspE/PulE/Tfp pilus assembly ATPase PilB-like protein
MRHAAWFFLGLFFLSGGLPWSSSALWAQEAQPAAPGEAAPVDPAAAAVDPAAAPADPAAPPADPNAPPAEEAAAPALVHVPADKWDDAHSILRVKNSLIAWWKLLLVWLVFVIWVKSGDWINRDTQIFDTGYGVWNPGIFFPFFAAILFFTFPIIVGVSYFWLAFPLLLVCYLGAFVPYAITRNNAVALHEKVFTSDWFRYELATLLSKVGMKVDTERKADYEKGAPVDLLAIGSADERTNQANLITARQSPGYLLVKEMVAEMADRRADRTMLDYTQQTVLARQLVDGVWHNGRASDRESGDVMLAVMKVLANLDMTDRRKKQSGKFGAKYKDMAYVLPIVSQGVKTGERVVVDLMGGKRASFKTFDELGMRKKLAEQWADQLGRDRGLVIISGLPEGGITTTTDVTIMETDRLLRDFVSIEEEKHRERELENIDVTTYSAEKGETPTTILPALIRKYPNVYICRDFVEPAAAKMLLEEISEERLVITTAQAKDATETLLRMLQKQVPQREFAKTVTAVLCVRLIRKLCEGCKVAYEPTPDLAKKLGLPEGKVTALYRTPKPEEIEKPCQTCGGIGYVGRTALFELLVADDQIRQILLKEPKLELLKKAAKAAGMRTFQEEGVLLIAKGVTSLAELQRVLKL